MANYLIQKNQVVLVPRYVPPSFAVQVGGLCSYWGPDACRTLKSEFNRLFKEE